MIPEHFRLKNTIKYPTSLIVGGLSRLGLEIADSLVEQGGYVIIADTYSPENIEKLNIFDKTDLISFIDYTTLAGLDEDLRRLDYIFYFNHESLDYMSKISTQDFLKFSNYLDTTLSLASKFEAKFLLTTAIRAHQLSLTYDDLSVKYGVSSTERHTVYTEMEVQRYAESLVMEYVEKTNLDARIIRLGEIIGEGIDFSTKSFFNDLMLDVAKGESLKLSKDGLESEWMVQLMDAAYGIIKAQFSKDTKGRIFSVSYPNPFTHLSIAYKVQELEASAKEIQFIEFQDNLPEIRLYKPAPNLSVIGWLPKVPIDKAITQSIASAKIYLLENTNNFEDEEHPVNVVDKLKGFLTLADKPQPQIDDYGGPISRLIAERKRQEELRIRSIETANDLKLKRSKRKKTVKEKTVDKLWNFSLGFGNTFRIFKNKSPGDLLRVFITIFVIVFVFIFIFSPIISIGKDILTILPFHNSTLNSLESNYYNGQNLHADLLNSSLKNMTSNLEALKSFSNIFNINQQYSEVQITVSAYSTIADGLNDIQLALEPFYNYLDEYKNNTQIRSGDEGYLTATTSEKEFSDKLTDFKNKLPYLSSGIEKYQKGLSLAAQINYSDFPEFIASKLINLNFRLKQDESKITSLTSLKYLPELFGLNQQRNYLFIIQDNTRLKPVGGEISTIILLSVKNGVITQSLIKSPEQIKFDYTAISDKVLAEVNLHKFTYVAKDKVNYQDLGNIYNYRDYANALSALVSKSLNKDIAGVVSINYSAFASLLNILDSNNFTVKVGNTSFPGNNFISQLSDSQTGTATITQKHALTSQIAAQFLNITLSNPKILLPALLNELYKGIASNDILIAMPELSYDSVVQRSSMDDSKIDLSTEGYSVGLNVEDPKLISLNKLPAFNISEEVRVSSKDKLMYTVSIQVPAIGISEELSLCVPPSVANDLIQVKGINASNYVINSSLDQKCIVTKLTQEKTLTFSWEVKTNLKQDDDKNYILTLPSNIMRGSTTILDKKIILEPDLKLKKTDPYVESKDNTLIFNKTLDSDFSVDLIYSK